jgi:hypothetical protein
LNCRCRNDFVVEKFFVSFLLLLDFLVDH